MLDWETVTAFALTLPDTQAMPHYGEPAIKINSRAFVMTGREAGSFLLSLDLDTVDMLMATDPDSYWQTPHYAGWPGVLVRYDSADPERIFAMIRAAHAWNAARPRPRPRKTA